MGARTGTQLALALEATDDRRVATGYPIGECFLRNALTADL